MMAQYQAVSFCVSLQIQFPIKIVKKEKVLDDEKNGFDPNAINLKLSHLVKMVHGSFEPKPKICDDFNEQNPECSKNSIEKKLKEFFVKDKRGEDPRLRYYANDEILA